jgi:hypothetical protein
MPWTTERNAHSISRSAPVADDNDPNRFRLRMAAPGDDNSLKSWLRAIAFFLIGLLVIVGVVSLAHAWLGIG